MNVTVSLISTSPPGTSNDGFHMHPCLQVQEILANVFSHISVGNQSELQEVYTVFRSSNSTLLRLATTCRAFSSPALDALWSFQPSLFFLMKLLPPDAFKIVYDYGDSVLVSYTERIFIILL